MVLPKYNFYVGFHKYGFIVNSGYDINKDTGDYYVNKNIIASSTIDVKKQCNYIYFDAIQGQASSFYDCGLYYYDKDNNYIGYYTYNQRLNSGNIGDAVGHSIVKIPDNTAYIAYTYAKDDSDFKESINNTRSPIYELKLIVPHYKELSKKYAKENGQEFFRESLDGKLNVFGDDYEFINGFSLEDSGAFIIEKYDENSIKPRRYSVYYKGEFNKTDCKFDRSKKLCELKTTAIDNYTNVLNNYENTYDLIKLAPEIEKINMSMRPLIQVYARGASSISNFLGGTYWETDTSEVVDDHSRLVNDLHFSFIRACNEMYVRGSSIKGLEGIYAGTRGDYVGESNYYHIYTDISESFAGFARIQIKRISDEKVMFESEKQIKVSYASDISEIGHDTIYIPSDVGDIQMIPVAEGLTEYPVICNVFAYVLYRRILLNVDSVEDSEGIKNTYDIPANDISDNSNYKKCIGLSGYALIYCKAVYSSVPTRYGLNDYGVYFTNKFIPSTAGIGRPMPICRSQWVNVSIWYVYDTGYYALEEKLRSNIILKNSYSIASVIKVLLNRIDSSIRHEATSEYSRFLYDENVPINMNRFYVYITQKTNILKGQYDQPAQKAEISFSDVMKMLRDCFRCYWYIENNKLKIEHISFFMNGGSYLDNNAIQLDITKLTDQFNKKSASYFQSEIEYDKSELNSRYEFGWMDNSTEAFGGITIDVNSNYVQKDKNEEINISRFSSDVDYMLLNPSDFSEDGFALLCPVKNNSVYTLPIVESTLIDEDNNNYKIVAQNWYASWPYLLRFYMYDMPARNIECNALDSLTVSGIKLCMEHSIEIPIKEDLDVKKLIKTTIGNGKIDEYSVNVDTRMAKIKLVYQPQ
jgi:hypothetical protein